jgi:hypothetical protein
VKQPRFEPVNAELSVANVVVELLRSKNVGEGSVLRFGSASAWRKGLKNLVEPTTLQGNGETAASDLAG